MNTANTAPPRMPEPFGIEDTLRSLGGPVFGFSPQSHLAEVGATSEISRARIVGVSLSYTYFRQLQHRDHRQNFVDLTLQQIRAIERAEASNLPRWMIEQITRLRYPTLWDAVRTAEVGPRDSKRTRDAPRCPCE